MTSWYIYKYLYKNTFSDTLLWGYYYDVYLWGFVRSFDITFLWYLTEIAQIISLISFGQTRLSRIMSHFHYFLIFLEEKFKNVCKFNFVHIRCPAKRSATTLSSNRFVYVVKVPLYALNDWRFSVPIFVVLYLICTMSLKQMFAFSFVRIIYVKK